MHLKFFFIFISIFSFTSAFSDTIFKTTSDDAFSINACKTLTISGCKIVAPIQPGKNDLAHIKGIYDITDTDLTYTWYGKGKVKAILINGVPFSNYWQLGDKNKYVFHPMVWGRYIFQNYKELSFHNNLVNINKLTSFTLPNGGYAFYYPNHYPLNRMIGPDLVYSAISQSEILSGYQRLDNILNSSASDEIARRSLDALIYPYENGGVNLSNVAMLELPMYRSNPEIILNGWLHALLYLNDWAINKDDEKISKLVENNLLFFINNQDAWYDKERSISRYSDTSPLRLTFVESIDNQNIRVLYRSKSVDLDNYIYSPIEDLNKVYSAYDTRILNRNNNLITLGLTCSQLFDTYIVSDKPFSVRGRSHKYDEKRSTPRYKKSWIESKSIKKTNNLYSYKAFPQNIPSLMCGYPTNFSKSNKKNYYHGQHIVALKYLSKFGHFDNDKLKSDLAKISQTWRVNTKKYRIRPIEDFETLENVLIGINRGKLYTQAKKIEDLGLSEYGK